MSFPSSMSKPTPDTYILLMALFSFHYIVMQGVLLDLIIISCNIGSVLVVTVRMEMIFIVILIEQAGPFNMRISEDQFTTEIFDFKFPSYLSRLDFSLNVKQCLRNNESAEVWNEAANFYLTFYSNDLENQKSYRIIGDKLNRAFLDIKREELPWVRFIFLYTVPILPRVNEDTAEKPKILDLVSI